MKYLLVFLLSVNSLLAFDVSGVISEKESGETIIGASAIVYKADSLGKTSINFNDQEIKVKFVKGIYTNKYGFYSITKIEEGNYYLVAKSLSFRSVVQEINLNEDLRIDIQMEKEDLKLKEVVVKASRETFNTAQISKTEIDPVTISRLPSIGSETDVFRSLMLLPGVQSSNELSSGLYIRGGSPDQNLILLDDVIVYNPSHLGGFISTFHTDALKNVSLIKGSMPAEYGGRLSSVIDITMKDGRNDRIGVNGNISLISSKLTVEGPIGDDITFMISGRRFYFDIVSNLAQRIILPKEERSDMPYYFYDLNAKVNWKIGENDQIFLSGYFGSDILDYSESDNYQDYNSREEILIDWGNKTGNLKWKHIFSSDLFSNFSLIYTDYKFNTNFLSESNSSGERYKDSFGSLSGINDVTLKGNAEYFGFDDHFLKFGFEYTNHRFESTAFTDFADIDLDIVNNKVINSSDLALFAQDVMSFGDLEFNLGIRTYYFSEGNYFRLEPRTSFSYQFSDDLKFIGSYTRANQFLHLISRQDINLPTDLWFPSTNNLKPSEADQIILGVHKDLTDDKMYRFTIESYYKKMRNLLEYKEDAVFSFGLPLEDQFTSGDGTSYGVELFLEKRFGDLTGWIGYTWAYTTRDFADLNQGKEFFPRYDRRHDVSSCFAIYDLNRNN